jgi:hypothetical protein
MVYRQAAENEESSEMQTWLSRLGSASGKPRPVDGELHRLNGYHSSLPGGAASHGIVRGDVMKSIID